MESRSSAHTVPLTAELTPFLQTDIEARLPGYVEKVFVDRGSLVHRGQLLVQLSAPEINAQRAASEANLHQAEAEVAQAEAQAAGAESTSAKMQEAAKTPGAIAGNELLQAEKQRDASQALVDSRKAAMKTAKERLQMSQAMERRG
ncbi:biotin/lipoyl-binding protein [Edaphobacter modestus]|uniref:biotin/lipoyl-binding protein n=1 Tax=Edaphobacter modestus TaxID=388466 RepID=UPI0013EE5D99|nr:biotin/lipoyl-binding protein [Edaphobacter modestus]